jgi:hypothetical protein
VRDNQNQLPYALGPYKFTMQKPSGMNNLSKNKNKNLWFANKNRFHIQHVGCTAQPWNTAVKSKKYLFM